METAVWIIQILLAVLFGLAGLMKLIQPKEKLAERMGWVNDFSTNTIRAIGVIEILGAIGLILPAATGILPVLTTLAAVGFVLDMIGAAVVHLRRKETGMVVANLVLLALAAFVVVGRLSIVPV